MTNLIFIGGAMGVGKTAVASRLKKILPNNVVLDGDACWDSTPFVCNNYTKQMVVRNITYLLNSFLSCPNYDNVIFTWVMHKQEIIDSILCGLIGEYTLCNFTLTACEQVLVSRCQKDINSGLRDNSVIERSLDRQFSALTLETTKIDTTNLTAQQVAQTIANSVKTI